jgi:tetratricopeptide (TPR) repeat protein
LVDNVELFSDAKASTVLAPRTRQELLRRAKAKYDDNQDDFDAVVAYADALFNSHKFVDAESILKEACALKETPDLLFNLAFVTCINGKEEEAKDLYRQVITLSEDSALAKSAEYELWKMGEKITARWLKK